MSMREYGVNGYGLVLTKEEVIEFIKKYDMENYKEEGYDDESIWDYIYNYDIIVIYGNFTGEAIKIETNGKDDWDDSNIYDNDDCFIIELNNWPSLFSKAYESYEDLIAKLKETYGKYLPIDFDYEEHLRHVVGTIWG